MDSACSRRASENRSMWKGVVVKSSVLPQRLRKVIGSRAFDISGVLEYTAASNVA